MRKIFKDWLTGPKSDHYEAGRALWILSVLCALGFSGWHLYLNSTFSIIDFGAGIGALLALGGGGIAVKDYSASKAKQ